MFWDNFYGGGERDSLKLSSSIVLMEKTQQNEKSWHLLVSPQTDFLRRSEISNEFEIKILNSNKLSNC